MNQMRSARVNDVLTNLWPVLNDSNVNAHVMVYVPNRAKVTRRVAFYTLVVTIEIAKGDR